MKPRILYVLRYFPQISETYIQLEIDALLADYDIRVITLNESDIAAKVSHPYEVIDDFEKILAAARKFKPSVIHTHWISHQMELVRDLAHALDVSFTVRAHSFDTLWQKPKWYKRWRLGNVPRDVRRNLQVVNDPRCAGSLCFPYAIDRLVGAGVRADRLTPCYPMFNRAMFHDESPNGRGVLSHGAALAKKKMTDFVDLAAMCPELDFRMYPMGYEKQKVIDHNEAKGAPVDIRMHVPYSEMPAIYKAHDWLVYPACEKLNTVGWPLCLMEAQAAGVGVCMKNLRPDLADYLGGGGILFDSIEELPEIISRPVPEDIRRKGFENCKRADVRHTIHLLTDLWKN
ncbi:MAG: glycosyltransferase family protein [Planctomycetota bacterium]|jgi:hypothetical protein